MTFRQLICLAVEYEPLEDTAAQRILQNILRLLSAQKPKALPDGQQVTPQEQERRGRTA